MAPQNQFSRDEHSLKYAQARIDEGFSSSKAEGGSPPAAFDPFTLLHLSPNRRSGVYHRRRFCVKEIVERIHGTARKPIDLTESGTNSLRKPTQLLKYITTKYLKFAEDVRPPYIGTYTKITDQSAASKLRRNPFAKILPTTDYGYDSEAEWEDPGEGEDLDSEGEEEAGEDEDGDEMEGFLDDEDGAEIVRAANLKHRPLNEDLEPSCTGLCWENALDPACWSSAEAKVMVDLSSLRLEILSGRQPGNYRGVETLNDLDSFHPPIDPYSTIYWQPSSAPSNPLPSSMDPPRLPLTTINRVNTLIPNGTPAVEENLKVPSRTEPTMVTFPPKGPKRMIAAELMTAFEAAVQGSDLTKAGLIEILKKQYVHGALVLFFIFRSPLTYRIRFPTQTKDAIKDTLNLVAKRVGTREADKRWVIKEDHLSSVTPGM
jgi:chromatin assembly factor 1 subunit A